MMFLVKSLLIVAFTLSQRRALNFGVAMATVLSWWFCADYYVVRCQTEHLWLSKLYLAVPVALTMVLSFVTRVEISNSMGSNALAAAPSIALPHFSCEKAWVWRTLLADLAVAQEGMAQSYVLWIRSAFGDWKERVRFAGWIPGWLVLISVLSIPGLRGRAVEFMASYVGRIPASPICKDSYAGPRTQDKIVAIDIRKVYPTPPDGPWSLDHDLEYRQFFLRPGNGTLALGDIFEIYVFSGDLPQAGRSLNIRSRPPECSFPEDMQLGTKTVDVRAGKSVFRLHCPPPAPGSGAVRFNIHLDLLAHSGFSLWSATIR